ncbi:hypothetical protein J2I47_14210 [Fibrella sp. HMF5335]|uniref:Uncharacterized protein n=1 Tax=Fibrella rubiginis TaxID=2817060 RepID=A0A939GH63_9BACT|nr:type VI secretion system tube protein TssD [Fibrella rubiginis]MBO0937708.1 hypothetical protein [Fibrella rubiginis]
MASFSAYLTVGSFKTWVNSVEINMHQEVDVLVRPASPTYGGKLTVAFNSTDDSLVTGWMFDPAMQLNGTITYVDPSGITLKEIAFINAYCIDMQEEFDGTSSAVSMITTIVISPEKVIVGGIQHNNNWPAIEAH